MNTYEMTMGLVTRLAGECSKIQFAEKPQESTLAREAMMHMEAYVGDYLIARPVIAEGSVFMYIPEDGYWIQLSRHNLEQIISGFHGSTYKYYTKKGEEAIGNLQLSHATVKGAAQHVFGLSEYADESFFMNGKRTGLLVENGFIEVTAQGVSRAIVDASDRARYRIDCEYDPAAKCPTWTRALQKGFSNTRDGDKCILFLQEFAGAVATGQATKYLKAPILVGRGENGKTTFQEGIELLVPKECVVHSSPMSWDKPYALVRLNGAMLNSVSELPGNRINNEQADLIKKVLDGNGIDVREIYKGYFKMHPTCGHIFSSNSRPESNDSSDGFWRRFEVLELNYSFKNDPERKTSAEILEDFKRERAGMLAWAIEGAVRLMKQGKYTEVPSSDDVKEEARIDSDPILSWIDESCVRDPAARELSSDLWQSFSTSTWFHGSHITQGRFCRHLKELGFERFRSTGAKQHRGFAGLSLSRPGTLDEAVRNFEEIKESVH